jgi:hypothetical protein
MLSVFAKRLSMMVLEPNNTERNYELPRIRRLSNRAIFLRTSPDILREWEMLQKYP